MYCPGHAGVKGNDQADSLAGKATIKGGMHLTGFHVLRSLRHYVWAQSQGQHTIDCLEERGVDRGSARRSSLKGQERAIANHKLLNHFKGNVRELLRDTACGHKAKDITPLIAWRREM